MKKFDLKIILIVLLLAIIVIFLTINSNNSSETPRLDYTNEVYNYTFTYPTDRTIEEYSADMVVVGLPQEDSVQSEAEVRVLTSFSDQEYGDFQSFVTQSLSNLCAADGPTGSIECEGIDSREDFSSDNLVNGEKIYLTQITRDFASDETSEDVQGPFYVFNISQRSDSDYAILVLHAPLTQTEINENLISTMAKSLQYTAE
ncbi:MAG: hypothetical protein NUV82_01805 [Candidatus Komeilibacteria bacterium]|nr:hypothetical protein [Candidatus Komeilibacteria bacterium]